VSKFGAVLTSAKGGHDPLDVGTRQNSVQEHVSTPLVVFSGDAFSPSLESSVLKGGHMIPVLNLLGIDIACYGNHGERRPPLSTLPGSHLHIFNLSTLSDFDFGEERLCELSLKSNFPWLLSNAVHGELDAAAGGLLAKAQEYTVTAYGSYRIGFFGLAGTDWPSNCQHLPQCEIQTPLVAARRMARHLRTVEMCDFIVAVTHMRLIEDLAVSRGTEYGLERIDLILGGHDHEVVQRREGDTDADPKHLAQGWQSGDDVRDGRAATSEGRIRVVKSGTNWKGLSVVQLRVSQRDGRAYLADVRCKSQGSGVSA